MAQMWDPIDPGDILDLWVEFGGADPFIPVGETITTAVVTPPSEVHKVTSAIEGTKVRWRTGPNTTEGKWPINFHVTTDASQQYDVDVILTVKERVKK